MSDKTREPNDPDFRAAVLLQRFFGRTLTEEEGRELLDLWEWLPDTLIAARKHYEINQFLRFFGRMERDRAQRFSRVPLPPVDSIFARKSEDVPRTDIPALFGDDPGFELAALEKIAFAVPESVAETPPDPNFPQRRDAHPSPKAYKPLYTDWYQLSLFSLVLLAFAVAVYFEFATVPTGSTLRVADSIAQVVETIDADFGDATPLKPGARVGREHIALQSGLLRLRFDNGTEIILDGPTDFAVNGKMRTFCRNGKVNAVVPRQARGFELSTPFSRIVDLGTEFSVVVDESSAQTHVLNGSVEVSHDKDERLPLSTGVAVRSHNGVFESIPLDTNVCTKPSVFESLLAEALLWRNNNREVLRSRLAVDADVAAWFDGENFFGGGSGSFRGGRLNDTRGGPKHAVRLRSKADCIEWNVPGRFESLTLVLSVRVHRLERLSRLLIGNDYYEKPGTILWQLDGNGDLQFRVRKPDESPSWTFDLPGVLTPKDLSTWTMLAVTVDGPGKTVVHYKDGKRAGRIPWSDPIPLELGPVAVGNENIGPANKKTPRFLDADIGEAMIYRRALSETEISDIYERLF